MSLCAIIARKCVCPMIAHVFELIASISMDVRTLSAIGGKGRVHAIQVASYEILIKPLIVAVFKR